MTQLNLESQALSGTLESLDNIILLLSKAGNNFTNYVTAKELKFMYSSVMRAYQEYSSVLTEQLLVSFLEEKEADEESILKYKFLYRQLKKKTQTETDFKLTIDTLANNYTSRCLIDVMLQSQEHLQQGKNGKATFDLLEKNMMILKSQISNRDIRETSTRNITDEVLLYEDMVKNPDKYRGVKIGIDKLDEVTGGFRKGELVIVMGATKVGKSIFLLNCQYNTIVQGYNSVYVTIEMPLEQARRRLVSRITELPYLKIKNVHLTGEELDVMKADLAEFEKGKGHSLIVDVPQECTPKLIEAKLRALLKTQPIDIIFLDYLLLMSPSTQASKMSREEKITQISLELKQMARSLNIPIITATQVTSDAGKKRDKTADEAYDWVDASQAKSVATNCDWLLSIKREPDINILNLGISVGRDGAIDGIIPLVIDYSKMLIGNYTEVPTAEMPVEEKTDSKDVF